MTFLAQARRRKCDVEGADLGSVRISLSRVRENVVIQGSVKTSVRRSKSSPSET